MIKILIADDEPEFREYLVDLVNWREYGLQVCGLARNGSEALQLAAEHSPQIALLDINMPVMDGLTAAEKLKQDHPDIKIALVTGYGEFEYARKALKLGVEDYVLKPFKKDELLSTILKFKVILQKKQEEAAQAKDDAYFVRELLLNAVISDEFDFHAEEFVRFFNRQGIGFESGPYQVVSIEIDNMYQQWVKRHDIALWKFAVSNVLEDLVDSIPKPPVFNGPEGRIVCIHLLGGGEDGGGLDRMA